MERTPVASSNIASIGFDAETETLEVEFKSGLVYQYYNVPQFMHEQIVTASSVGAFFNANVRNAFACAKV